MPTSQTSPSGNSRLPGLDALRAVAALCVVIMHLHAIYPAVPEIEGKAYLAVDFFFLLSGFVMARTYEVRLRGDLTAKRFLIARARRMWPTMAVGAVLSLPFAWRDHQDAAIFLAIVLPNLVLLPTFAVKETFGLNVPAWSIFFELVANFAHGSILARLGTRTLSVLLGLFAVALIGCALRFGTLDLGSLGANFGGGLARVAFTYTLGILLWRWRGDRAPLPVPTLFAFVAMPIVFGVPTLFGSRTVLVDLIFVMTGCPLILWGGLRVKRFTTIAEAAGTLSFPLYAVHYPVLLASEHVGLPPAVAVALTIIAAALINWRLGHYHIPGRSRTAKCAM